MLANFKIDYYVEKLKWTNSEWIVEMKTISIILYYENIVADWACIIWHSHH